MASQNLIDLLECVDKEQLPTNGNDGINFEVPIQLDSLGLQEYSQLRGKRILDIGCGIGTLVEFFRSHGIYAEGIDSNAPVGPYYMKQNITSVHPMRGCIPRENGYYDLVLLHSVRPFVVGLSSGTENDVKDRMDLSGGYSSLQRKEVKTKIQESFMDAYFIMAESLRVTKQGGKIITNPFIDKLDSIQVELARYHCTVEKFETESSRVLGDNHDDLDIKSLGFDEYPKTCAMYRYGTIITVGGLNSRKLSVEVANPRKGKTRVSRKAKK